MTTETNDNSNAIYAALCWVQDFEDSGEGKVHRNDGHAYSATLKDVERYLGRRS